MRIQGVLPTFALVIIVSSLAACNLSASTEPPLIDESAANTAAAETIVAQLTQIVETVTPAAVESPLPEPTQTAVIADITETSVPTAAPTQPPETATPTTPPTPTLDPNDPKAGLGEPAFFDTFDDASNWPTYSDKHVSFEVKNSRLVMTAFEPDRYNGWVLTWPVISDYYLEMTTKTKQCAGKDQYGAIVRAVKTDQGYIGYLYSISCDGHFSLRRWNGEKYVQLVDWTPSEHIKSGSDQTNRLGLMVNGNKFSMYANGKLIGETQDDTHQEGRFGVVIGSANTPDVQVLVTEIAYWDLP